MTKQVTVNKMVTETVNECRTVTERVPVQKTVTVMERLLEELSFEAPDMKRGRVTINAAYARERLEQVAQDEDLSRFIL